MKQNILRWFSIILLIIYTIFQYSYGYKHIGSFGSIILLGALLCFYYSTPSDTRKEIFNVNRSVPTKNAAILITVCVAIMTILVYKGIITL